jgi:elongation factor G
MDRQGADFKRCVAEIKERLLAYPLLLQLPIGREENFIGVIDLVEEKAYFYSQNPSEVHVYEEGPIPPDLAAEVKEARLALIEGLADVDDSLVEDFLEGREVAASRLKKILREGTLSLKCVPVLLGSAFKNKGVQPLLDAVVDYLPSPKDIPPVKGLDPKGSEVVRTVTSPFAALVFKLWNDTYAGHLAFLRIYSGTLKTGEQVLNTVKMNRERVGRILKMHANKREEIKEAGAGDIVALVGLKNSSTGDTLADEKNPVVLENLVIPEPVIHIALYPKSKDDQDKLSVALGKLTAEDPSFRVRTDPETGEIIMSGMGELHLEIIAERLRREFKVPVESGAPQVAFRETITRAVESVGKHVRQSGGHGQYGVVNLRLEPLPPGSGLVYETEVVGGTVPKEYHNAVGEGALEACRRGGVLAGFPVTDLKITLFDGAYHEVDSSEMAFSIAGSIALKEGLKQAGPVILEPIMDLEIVTPEEYVGDVIRDLSSRRGLIVSQESQGKIQVVRGEVPLAQMFGYSTELRGKTQGRAVFTMQFGRYRELPENVARLVISTREKLKEARGRA